MEKITEHINGEYVTKYYINVFFGNKFLGVFAVDVDGYYSFYPVDNNGCWDAYALRWIADALDVVNKPHDDLIQEEFKKMKEKEENGKQ